MMALAVVERPDRCAQQRHDLPPHVEVNAIRMALAEKA
jgi:hypothetical protein